MRPAGGKPLFLALFSLRSDLVEISKMSLYVSAHTLTLLCTVCAVPELALLLVSGVLECWKHLAGRFNIQLTGSQTSYITAENPAPPPPQTTASRHHPYIQASSSSAAPPFGVISPSLSTLSSSPVLPSPQSLFEQRGGGLTAPLLCLSISPPADCI